MRDVLFAGRDLLARKKASARISCQMLFHALFVCSFYSAKAASAPVRSSAPPHSTTVKPRRSGADSYCAGSSTGSSSAVHAMNTRSIVSGSGVTVSRADCV